jgi:hypothetical protein
MKQTPTPQVPSNLDVKLLCCDKNPLHQLAAESTCGTHFHSTCLDVPTPQQLKNVSLFQRMEKKNNQASLMKLQRTTIKGNTTMSAVITS